MLLWRIPNLWLVPDFTLNIIIFLFFTRVAAVSFTPCTPLALFLPLLLAPTHPLFMAHRHASAQNMQARTQTHSEICTHTHASQLSQNAGTQLHPLTKLYRQHVHFDNPDTLSFLCTRMHARTHTLVVMLLAHIILIRSTCVCVCTHTLRGTCFKANAHCWARLAQRFR